MRLIKKTLLICIGLLLFSFIATPVLAPEELENNNIIRTPITATYIKGNDKTNLIIWSGIRNVYENGEYKPREKAKSFKGDPNFNCVVKFDGYNIAECLDYNETSRTIKLSITESRWTMFWENPFATSFETPLKKYHLEFNKSTKEFEKIYNKEFKKIIGFEWYNIEKEYTLKTNPSEVLEFGENSTELILTTAETDNMEDAFVSQQSQDTSYGNDVSEQLSMDNHQGRRIYIKWNITAIPSGATIDEARIYLYQFDAHDEAGSPDYNASMYHVYDQSWQEGLQGATAYYPNLTWNSQPCGEWAFDNSTSCNITGNMDSHDLVYVEGRWENWSIIDALRKDYGDSKTNFSLLLRFTSEPESPPAATRTYLGFNSKESGTNVSYLNITYTPTANDPPTVNSQAPENNTYGYSKYINFTYNVTDPDADSITNCALWLKHDGGDWELNYTDSSITQTVNQSINITFKYNEHLTWLISCYDDNAKQGNSTINNYSVYSLAPIVTLQYPEDDVFYRTRNINFTYDVSTHQGTIDTCYLWLDGVLNQTDATVVTGVNQSFNVTLNYSHYRSWLIECESDEGLKGNSTGRAFVYNTIPTIPTMTPVNNTIITEDSILITCSGSTDPDGDTIRYEFYGGTAGASHAATQLHQNTTATSRDSTSILKGQLYYYRCRANDNLEHSATPIRKVIAADLNANCSGANSTAIVSLNFSFADENFTRLHNVTFAATFIYWGNTTNETRSISGLIINETYYCLTPKNATSLYVDAIISYSKIGYDTRNYFFDENDMITPNLQNIILYLAASSVTTEISITVTNAEDIPLPDIITEAWIYDVGTDTYSLVQSEITNFQGECTMNLIKGDYFIFKFYENGILKDTTPRFKLTEDLITFKITEAEEPLKPTIELNLLDADFTWVNLTRNISFDYSNANLVNNLNQICWVVNNITAQNISSLYSHCFIIASGSYSGIDSYIIPAQQGYYRAYAYGLIEGVKYSLGYYEIDFGAAPIFDQEGILLGSLIIMGLGGLGLATKNPSITIMMVLLGVVINSFTYLWILPWYALISIITVGMIFMIIIRA